MAKKKRLSAKELNRLLGVSIKGELVQSNLRRLEELKDDAEFFQACRDFWKKEKSGEQTKWDFYKIWSVFPINSWLLNESVFRAEIERAVKRKGRVASITIYPWSTLSDVRAEYEKAKRSITKGRGFRVRNWDKWRRGLGLTIYLTTCL